MPADEPRLLHRRGVPGYTHDPSRSMHEEPEAVPRDVQDQISWRAHRHERQTWQAIRSQLLLDAETLSVDVKHLGARRAARSIERVVAALDRQLT